MNNKIIPLISPVDNLIPPVYSIIPLIPSIFTALSLFLGIMELSTEFCQLIAQKKPFHEFHLLLIIIPLMWLRQ